MEDLAGKVAVVTGAASGIGRGIAERLGREGMRVVLADIEEAPLEAAVGAMRADGVEAVAQLTDVSRLEDVEALRDRALSAFGAVHVVSSNAGVSAGGPIWTIDQPTWDWVMGVNLWSILHAVRTFVPLLVEQNEGYVLNTASMQGLTVPAGAAPYTVTKHAVVALSEVLFHDLKAARSKVGVSVLCPGPVATRIYASDRNRPENRGKLVELGEIPPSLAQGWSPEELADLVLECMRTRRFYVLTHPEYDEDVENRFQGIVGRDAPAVLQPLSSRKVAPKQ